MGRIFDIKRGSTKDGPGIRTSVFLKGCPLRCVWCHNPESQSPEPQRAASTGEVCGREMSVDEVMREVLADKPFYGTAGGVTFTGGEPTAQPDFLIALAAAAKARGVSVAVDTCGYAPWDVFARLLPVTDLFLYDVKCLDAVRHRELTGVDTAQILENFSRLSAAGARIWVRCPLVPGLNDSDADLSALRTFVAAHPRIERVEICPYNPMGLEKYAKFGILARYVRREFPSEKDVARWRALLKDVTGGNGP